MSNQTAPAKLNVLSLFAGIGGLELGLERAGMHVVGQVEIDPFCRRVLAKHWPDVPRHDDVKTAADWWLSMERPTVDVICGGFPCQDISVAGRRAGIIDGEKSSLWTYLAHTVRVLRPRYVLVENVSRLVVSGLDVVAADLAEIGYDLRWDCVPASAVGANHRRDRWFGIAYPQRQQLRVEPVTERRGGSASVVADDGTSGDVADSDRSGLEGRRVRGTATERRPRAAVVPDATGFRRRQGRQGGSAGVRQDWATVWPQALAHTQGKRRRTLGPEGSGETGADDLAGHASERTGGDSWAVEPDVGRVADGVPNRVDRLRALGNAVVPQVAEHVGRLIVEHAQSVVPALGGVA